MRVTAPDLELWLTRYLRVEAAAAGRTVEVSNKEPAELALPIRQPLIVVRDDSGSRLDWTTYDRSIGVSVLAGSKTHDQPANGLARWVASVLHDDALPLVDGSPIARVVFSGCHGPYPVADDLDVARRYLTAQYIVTGTW